MFNFREVFQCGALADSDNESEEKEKGNPCSRIQNEKIRMPHQNTKYGDDEKKNFFVVENNIQVDNGAVIALSDKLNQCNRKVDNATDKNTSGNTNYTDNHNSKNTLKYEIHNSVNKSGKKNFENVFSRRSSASTVPTTGTYVCASVLTCCVRTCMRIICNIS